MTKSINKKENRGGKRIGAGRPAQNLPKKNARNVMLTDAEYKAITGKYGTFAAGVRSLL